VVVEGLVEGEGIAVLERAAGATAANGMLAIADESAGDDGSDLKLVAWSAIAAALDLRVAEARALVERPAVVRPVVETEPVDSHGDAADDPAIWVNPADPSRSRVIATNKKGGLYVYDLEGRLQQSLPDGRMNNVDLRDGFPLGGESVSVATASNRSTDSIAVYRIDMATGELTEAAHGVLPTGFADPYGLCMYHSTRTGEYYVFVNDGDTGVFRQWRLFDNGQGRVAAEQVREFSVGSQAEGCVADDETGQLYIAEENVGLWKYAAEPDGGTDRVQIDTTGDGGRLTDDVEGVALWLGREGSGYLVASNQGANDYAVYRREGDNAYIGHFHVVASATQGIDGASETDGLDVSSVSLGDAYPDGMLVVQDGRNIAPEERQNFKFVSWRDVAAALNLP
jgi:3-phytase